MRIDKNYSNTGVNETLIIERRKERTEKSQLECLVIEDNFDICALYSSLVTSCGALTYTAMTLEEGLYKIYSNDLDLVLLDGEFPDFHGEPPRPHFIAVVMALRAVLTHKHKRPVIALITGLNIQAEMTAYTLSGCIDFVFQKPLSNVKMSIKSLLDVARLGISWGRRSTDVLREGHVSFGQSAFDIQVSSLTVSTDAISLNRTLISHPLSEHLQNNTSFISRDLA